jgi:hypothetical protein
MKTCEEKDSLSETQSSPALPNNQVLTLRLQLETALEEIRGLEAQILSLERENRSLREGKEKIDNNNNDNNNDSNDNNNDNNNDNYVNNETSCENLLPDQFLLTQSKNKRKKTRKKERSIPVQSQLTVTPHQTNIPPLIPLPPPLIPKTPTSFPERGNINTIHLYVDSNTRDIHPDLISTHINTYNKQLNKQIKAHKIQIHTTYDLEKTQKDMHTRNHANSIVIINNLTNHARRQHKIPKVNYHLHTIIEHLQTQTPHIIITESAPSLKFDIFPYNRAARNVAIKHKVQWAPTLIGENHILRDRVHIQRQHYPLLAQTYAAAILKMTPFSVDKQRPPHGPFGTWWFPWGHPGRPHPSHWAPLPSFFNSQRLPRHAPETWNNVARGPASYFRRGP